MADRDRGKSEIGEADAPSPDPSASFPAASDRDMTSSNATLFDADVWGPALLKYGVVSHLSVALFNADGEMICGPLPHTPLVATFQRHGYASDLFAGCARQCLEQGTDDRRPIVRALSCIAVVGVSLQLNGAILGAVVAGYAFISFGDAITVTRLSRETGVPFRELWSEARRQQPIPAQRLILHGEVLQVLGDTLLRENHLRRQSDYTATQLSHLAHHDVLTGLPNRALLGERLARALVLAHRHQRCVAVLFLDVDRFKDINDSLGHALGDSLLRMVAGEVTQCVRNSDTVARHGGDEFIVVLSEVAQAEDAAAVAQKILTALARPHTVDGHDLRISVSIGISVYPHDGGDAETLLKHADLAMYGAKELGRDRYRFFQPELHTRAVTRRSIEAALRRALADREFVLFYQPKVNLQTGAIVGAEALIRWRDPDRGLVPPDEFIPIAETCGLIAPIGRWVVCEACRQARAWQVAGLGCVPVAVNVSAVEFRNHDFVQNVADSLNDTDLAPHYLEMEVTEGVLMGDVPATKVVLRALKALGVQLAIDDFGTGWSSLSYLGQFPVDALKIDRSFVRDISVHAHASPIVRAVISMAKSLRLRVIAEGVETLDQLTFLQAEACGEGQGYYFSRPVCAEQFGRLLALKEQDWSDPAVVS